MMNRIIAPLSLALAASLPCSAALAQPAAQPALSVPARQEIVASLATALRERYVFPDKGEQAAARIEGTLASGAYDSLDPQAFAERLQADIDTITRDKHLRIAFTGAPPPAPAGSAEPATPRPRAEAGIVRADRLTGGVGYIEVSGFPPIDFARPTFDRAMSALEGSSALIVDARRNGGGDPATVAYLVSFLVPADPPVHINTIVGRVAGTGDFTREEFKSQPTPVNFADVPVYVLTSDYTFSGGEEFAYDIQALKRGVLVGEVTGGGANPTGRVDLGNDFAAMIPFGRAENPVTLSNWEGTGVSPDISVPAAEALRVALERLGQAPVTEIQAASQQQVFAPRTTPLPASEAAIRGLATGLASGAPDYAAMSPQFAEVMREELAELTPLVAGLGALRSVTFRRVDMVGGDEYDLSFENGSLNMAVVLGADGKILAGNIQPVEAGER